MTLNQRFSVVALLLLGLSAQAKSTLFPYTTLFR